MRTVSRWTTNVPLVSDGGVDNPADRDPADRDPADRAPADHDLAVIGLGSGGERIAQRAATAGWRVIGFEERLVGGECPFTACMPSKALLHAASTSMDWDDARRHRDDVVSGRDDSQHVAGLRDAGVQVIRARAHITGVGSVEANGTAHRARHVVVATGGAPKRPPIDGVDHPRVWTSEDFYVADELPESLIVIGAGAIGCEVATIMAGFDRPVRLLDVSPTLLGGSVDDHVAELLAERLDELGVTLHLDADIDRIDHDADGAVVHVGNGNFRADRVLVATGKRLRTDGLGLDTVGVDAADDDGIDVDDDLRVAGQDWLRAVGDVNGDSPWTHGANHEAERLWELLSGSDAVRPVETDMPNAVFTDPPVASVGLTAHAARDGGRPCVVGRARYSDTPRHSTDQLFDGSVAVVVGVDDERILGCSGIGAGIDDLVSIVTAWQVGDVDVRRASTMIIPFPTRAEVLGAAIRDAARQLG